MLTRQIITKSAPDRAVEVISSAIQKGILVPGQRLIEAELIKKLGISRNPLREALKRLAADGLITLTPFQGASVRMISQTEAFEMVQILQVMTGLAARLAAENINIKGHRSSFKAAAKKLMGFRTKTDSIEFVKEREKFYTSLLQIAGNNELHRMVQGVRVHLLRVQMINQMRPEARQKQFDMYQKVINHILLGEASKAEAAMQKRAQIVLQEMARLSDTDTEEHFFNFYES